MTSPRLRSASVFVGVLAGAFGTALAQSARALPERDLVVELRQVEDRSMRRLYGAVDEGAGSTTTAAPAGAGAPATTGPTAGIARAPDLPPLQVRVPNGGRASVRIGEAMPLEFVRIAWSPGGVDAAQSIVWVDRGGGITVNPRWTGDGKLVWIELSAERVDAGARTEPLTTGRNEPLTTARAVLGEWVAVARSPDASSLRRNGLSVGRDPAFVMELRVTAP